MAKFDSPQDVLDSIWELHKQIQSGEISPDVARVLVKSHSNVNAAHANLVKAATAAHRIGAGEHTAIRRLANGGK